MSRNQFDLKHVGPPAPRTSWGRPVTRVAARGLLAAILWPTELAPVPFYLFMGALGGAAVAGALLGLRVEELPPPERIELQQRAYAGAEESRDDRHRRWDRERQDERDWEVDKRDKDLRYWEQKQNREREEEKERQEDDEAKKKNKKKGGGK